MSYTSTIKYKGNVIATLQENEDVELDCAGTVMDGDIEVSVDPPPDPTSVFNDNSWDTIKSAVDAGTAASYWKVGDRKKVILNGVVGNGKTFANTETYCFILGFDHNKSVESNGEYTIHIGFGASALSGGAYITYVDSKFGNTVYSRGYFAMNSSNTNIGGWKACQMRTDICPAFKNALPSDLQSVIRSVTKYQNQGGGSSSGESQDDEIFLMSEMEIFGSNTHGGYTANQAQYNFYKGTSSGGYGASKIRYRDTDTSTGASWFERSAASGGNQSFCYVSQGSPYTISPNNSLGFAPCLCL